MKYHLEGSLRLNLDPQSNRNTWSISEIDEGGQPVGHAQIPWQWSFIFTAISCELLISTEIEAANYRMEALTIPKVVHEKIIQAKLVPAERDLGRPQSKTVFSMFGTGRPVEEFYLSILPLRGNAPDDTEHCHAWGGVSYTSENDFHESTTADIITFTLFVASEKFEEYVALVAQGALTDLSVWVGRVNGFYSDWSPMISTQRVKVLTAGDEQKVEPNVEGIIPPRLGSVGTVKLTVKRRIGLGLDGAR